MVWKRPHVLGEAQSLETSVPITPTPYCCWGKRATPTEEGGDLLVVLALILPVFSVLGPGTNHLTSRGFLRLKITWCLCLLVGILDMIQWVLLCVSHCIVYIHSTLAKVSKRPSSWGEGQECSVGSLSMWGYWSPGCRFPVWVSDLGQVTFCFLCRSAVRWR